ncbi:MAG: hypothetical protein LBE12_13975 [Planctomycetaceae bacterium]|nr:hypothetical protein [Planctomycetaceae bacterium]
MSQADYYQTAMTLSTINSPLSAINNLVPAGLRKHKRLTKCRENRTKKMIPLIDYIFCYFVCFVLSKNNLCKSGDENR